MPVLVYQSSHMSQFLPKRRGGLAALLESNASDDGNNWGKWGPGVGGGGVNGDGLYRTFIPLSWAWIKLT